MNNPRINISPLFASVGLLPPLFVEMNEHTYETDPTCPENNWLYPAFLAFQKLQQKLIAEGKTVETFVTIGTGAGIDAIGASEIFHPRQMILTDIHPGVLPVAERNVRAHTATTLPCHVWQGNLTEPLRQHGIVADVIYANLPNIPLHTGGAELYKEQLSSSFHASVAVEVPEFAKRYLLSLQYALLRDARTSLSDGGSLLINLGGRVPIDLVQHLFAETGYAYEELVTTLKTQSQPGLMLESYARAEKENGVEFDFYLLNEARACLNTVSKKSLSAQEMKDALAHHRVTAAQALDLHTKHQKPIGHLVQVLRAVKQEI